MSPRIIDIAKEADVSQATVSMTLNTKPGVSDEVRQKIIKIAKKKVIRTSIIIVILQLC